MNEDIHDQAWHWHIALSGEDADWDGFTAWLEANPAHRSAYNEVALLDDAQKVHIPDFIKDRLLRLDDMIAMVRDASWALPDADKQRVLGALTYFCDPNDVIPDHVEVLGFLDVAGAWVIVHIVRSALLGRGMRRERP